MRDDTAEVQRKHTDTIIAATPLPARQVVRGGKKQKKAAGNESDRQPDEQLIANNEVPF